MTVDQENPIATRKAPGKRWYVLAGLLALAGLVVAGVALWLTFTTIDDDFQRATFPGQAELTLSEAGTYTIFVEHPVGSSLDPAVGRMMVEVISEQGDSVQLNNPAGSLTYTLAGESGEAVLEFEVDEAGTFLMVADYPTGDAGPSVTLAVNKGFGGRLFAGIGTVILVPLVTWTTAIVIVVVTFLKRRKAAAAPTSPPTG